MNQPVLSIDIAKGKSVAVAFTSYGIQVKKPFSFSHSPEDVSSLLSLLEELEESTQQQPTVVGYGGHRKLPGLFRRHAESINHPPAKKTLYS